MISPDIAPRPLWQAKAKEKQRTNTKGSHTTKGTDWAKLVVEMPVLVDDVEYDMQSVFVLARY